MCDGRGPCKEYVFDGWCQGGAPTLADEYRWPLPWTADMGPMGWAQSVLDNGKWTGTPKFDAAMHIVAMFEALGQTENLAREVDRLKAKVRDLEAFIGDVLDELDEHALRGIVRGLVSR